MSQGETRDHLLDAALVVIADRGLHGLTMRAVSAEADSALGLVNYHFEDKDALIVEAYERIVDRLISASMAAVERANSDHAKLTAFIETVFDEAFLNTDYLTLRLSLWAAAASDGKIAELNTQLDRNYWNRLTDLIGRARPELSSQDARDRATDIMIMQNGMWLTWVVRPDRDALERCRAQCRAIVLH